MYSFNDNAQRQRGAGTQTRIHAQTSRPFVDPIISAEFEVYSVTTALVCLQFLEV